MRTLHHLSARCRSTAAATAFAAAAEALRLLSSALYRANIRGHIDQETHETLKGRPPSHRKLQILTLVDGGNNDPEIT